MTYIDTRTYYVLYEDSPGLQNDEFQPGKGKKNRLALGTGGRIFSLSKPLSKSFQGATKIS